MRGRSQRDDGWDEGRTDRQADGRRDSWQNGNGYHPGTAPGYPGTGYANGAGYGGPDSYAAQSEYGAREYSAQGYGARGYDTRGYPETASGGYAQPGYASTGYASTGASGRHGLPSSPAGSEFLPADESASTPRPYGRLSIFTLLDDKVAEFDRLAERAAEGVRTAEPDTLVYVIHVVPKAPMQRIIYEIYRDRAAFESHEQQPHIQRFVADRRACVLATNIIDLRLKYAKVAALANAQPAGAPAGPAAGQETQLDHAPAGLGSATPSAAAAGAAGQWYADGTSGQYGSSGRYPALGSGSQSDGGGRHAESGGYGRSGGYTYSDQSREADQDSATGADDRAPRFEPAQWDAAASRAGRY